MARFVPLTADDVAEVMRIERLPGYEDFIGRYEADEHRANLASPTWRYCGLRNDAGGLDGFVLLQRFDEPMVHLRRIAVARPGEGLGVLLLRGAMDLVFETTAAEDLDLDVALGNPRARHVYEREGFTEFRPPDDVHFFLKIPRARWSKMRAPKEGS